MQKWVECYQKIAYVSTDEKRANATEIKAIEDKRQGEIFTRYQRLIVAFVEKSDRFKYIKRCGACIWLRCGAA